MKKKTREEEEEEESIISNISETKQRSKFVQVLANKEATEHMYIFIGNGAQMKTVFVVQKNYCRKRKNNDAHTHTHIRTWVSNEEIFKI